tara:strand:- start:1702 stop:3015 length:1314 start_codon:yes stop_codon:yes gene_type:complete
MGGGTGTGAAPVIAEAARERGILTVGVVTKPFEYEGIRRTKIAEQGIKDLTSSVDTLIIIPNQNLFRIANKDTTFVEAFKMADEVLYNGVKGVTDLIVKQGRINLDFADIQTVMLEMGKAMMGTGEAEGEDRAIKAAELAISNPLLDDTSISNAKGVIINISGGEDVKLYEIDEIAAHIKKQCKEDVNLIVGNTIENIADGKIRVSLLASGISAESSFKGESELIEDSKFIKPRLVSNSDNKNINTIKPDFGNKKNSNQADLEDFLSKEVNDVLLKREEEINSEGNDSEENFFIPKEQIIPAKDKNTRANPFKEADLLNANLNKDKIGTEENIDEENVSLISRLSSNVKEKAINVGSKAMSIVSEVANKSLENTFIKKEEELQNIEVENNITNRVEPSFLDNNNTENDHAMQSLDNSNNIHEDNFANIPSFLKKNRD